MHTACSSGHLEGSPPGTPPEQAPHPPEQAAPPVNRMTNRCKNITLPQTSFAGGKNTTNIKEKFCFRFRFCSVWIGL